MVIGKLLFGFVLGNIASTLANKEARMTSFRNMLAGVQVDSNFYDTKYQYALYVDYYLENQLGSTCFIMQQYKYLASR